LLVLLLQEINAGFTKDRNRSSLRRPYRWQFITINTARAKQDYTFGLSIASDKSKNQFIKTLKQKTMKKFLMAVLVTVAVGSSAFAADVNKLSSKVKNNFDAQFFGAQDIEWAVRDTYTKFSFVLAEQKVEAFYSQMAN
jgi:hypothetical protein